MATPSPKGFVELLQSAVHEPGTLSQAYQLLKAGTEVLS